VTDRFRLGPPSRVADAGFLALDRVPVLDAHGEPFDRIVVRHPGAVVIVPVEGADALCVRQFRAATGGVVLELPAGKRDHDHEPPESTAARELEEELGLHAGALVKLAEFWNSPGFCDEYSHVFLALDLVEVDAPAPTSPEEAEMSVERVPLAALEQRVAARDIVDAKTMIGMFLARQYLAGSHTPLDS
jgi:ADP-ribose pyrophosphatase